MRALLVLMRLLMRRSEPPLRLLKIFRLLADLVWKGLTLLVLVTLVVVLVVLTCRLARPDLVIIMKLAERELRNVLRRHLKAEP